MRCSGTVVFALALWVLVLPANVARAADSETEALLAGIDTPEEAAAFLLFGFGFRDICQSAYGDSNCPSQFGAREVSVTDKVYRHRYSLSENLCVLKADLVTLASGDPLEGVLNMGRIRSIEAKYADRYGRSVEYAFTFSGEGVNASPGQASDSFVFFHEYFDRQGFDHETHARLELEAMRRILGTYQDRYCQKQP